MFRKLFCVSAVAAISLASFSMASADDTEGKNPHANGEWVSVPYTVSYTGSGLSKKNQGVSVSGEIITTNSGEQSGNVAIICMNNTMALSVAVKPIDFVDFIRNDKKGRKVKVYTPKIFINDEKVKTKAWQYVKETGVLIAHGKTIKRKIYNSAIRGDAVRMVAGDNEFYLNLPKPNRVFGNFGWPCGLGTGRDNPKPKGIYVRTD